MQRWKATSAAGTRRRCGCWSGGGGAAGCYACGRSAAQAQHARTRERALQQARELGVAEGDVRRLALAAGRRRAGRGVEGGRGEGDGSDTGAHTSIDPCTALAALASPPELVDHCAQREQALVDEGALQALPLVHLGLRAARSGDGMVGRAAGACEGAPASSTSGRAAVQRREGTAPGRHTWLAAATALSVPVDCPIYNTRAIPPVRIPSLLAPGQRGSGRSVRPSTHPSNQTTP